MLNPSPVSEAGHHPVMARSGQDYSTTSTVIRMKRAPRAMSISEATVASETRYTGYLTSEIAKAPERRHQRAVGLGASALQVEIAFRSRLDSLTNSSQLSSAELELVLNVLRNHFLFSTLATKNLMQICSRMEKTNLCSGETVVSQGDTDAEHFYIISNGDYQVEVAKREGESPILVAELSSGAAFGEMALLYAAVRTATVRCVREGTCFRLSRASYLLAVMDGDDLTVQRREKSLEDASLAYMSVKKRHAIEDAAPWLFSALGDGFDELNRNTLLKTIVDLHIDANEQLFSNELPSGPIIAVVIRGTIAFRGDPSKSSRDHGRWRVSSFGDRCTDTTLTAGDTIMIGSPGDEGIMSILYNLQTELDAANAAEQAAKKGQPADENSIKIELRKRFQFRLLGGSYHHCSMQAQEECHLALIPLSDFMEMLPLWSDQLLYSNDGVRSLILNTAFGKLATAKEIDAMAFAFKPAFLGKGIELTTIGRETTKLTMILSGTYSVEQAGGLFVCDGGPGDIIGEQSLAESVPSKTTCRTKEACVALQLPKEAYRSMKLAHLAGRARAETMGPVHAQLDEPRMVGDDDVKLSDFQALSIIGVGGFASVALVQHVVTQVPYVLKKINRDRIVQSNLQDQVLQERSTLGYLDHPNIAKLYSTFSSNSSLFMLCEPCLGGELYSLMRKHSTFEESVAGFYTACVVAAFEYMHAHDIMYRDLKPENLVIAANGYAKVVDFGFAKRTRSRTFTLCGTPEYLAPELILMKGYRSSVDWWAIGVLLYEMLLGGTPFIWIESKPNYNLPPTELYKNILNPKFEYHFLPSQSCETVDLVMSLLERDPLRRLGCLTDRAKDVKTHAFFAAVCQMDWHALHSCSLSAPLVPELSGPTDVSQFDVAYEPDDFLSEAEYTPQPSAWDATF